MGEVWNYPNFTFRWGDRADRGERWPVRDDCSPCGTNRGAYGERVRRFRVSSSELEESFGVSGFEFRVRTEGVSSFGFRVSSSELKVDQKGNLNTDRTRNPKLENRTFFNSEP